MASRWSRSSDRISFAPQVTSGGAPLSARPPGRTSGRWIALGPVWIRLGRRRSWQDEDTDAKMIKPVEP
jgi:hypothetical protein